MIEPTTSTASDTAEGAEQGATARESSRTENVNPGQDTERNTGPTTAADEDDGGFTDGGERPATEAQDQRPDRTEDEAAEEAAVGSEDSAGDGPEESEAEKVARLEREGDIAADYLEELLDIADVDGDIDLDVEGDRAVVAVVGGDLRRLTGSDGEVLDALQELTRLAVLRETGNRSRLMLDVGGFRARRRQELEKRAAKVADEVVASGSPVRMDPMTPFERKIVHDTVAAKGLISESEGEEPNRRVVVKPN